MRPKGELRLVLEATVPKSDASSRHSIKTYDNSIRVHSDVSVQTRDGSPVTSGTPTSLAVPSGPIGVSPQSSGATQKKSFPPLTLDQIMQLSAAKIPDDIIVTAIQKSGSHFDLTPDLMIKLKTGGVSDAVLRAMSQ